MNEISRSRVMQLIHYDRKTGKFYWNNRSLSEFVSENSWKGFQTSRAGREVGSKCTRRYVNIRLDKKDYYAHRLAWLITYGELPKLIDHINGDTLDNRIENLRAVSQRDNSHNCGIGKRNKSGVLGVHWSRSNNGWVSQIRVDGNVFHLGTFNSLNESAKARKAAERRYGFHKNHGERAANCRKAMEAASETEAA